MNRVLFSCARAIVRAVSLAHVTPILEVPGSSYSPDGGYSMSSVVLSSNSTLKHRPTASYTGSDNTGSRKSVSHRGIHKRFNTEWPKIVRFLVKKPEGKV
jgi:hypothetical protein